MKIVELKNGKFALLQSNNCKALTVKNGEVLFELDSVNDFIGRYWYSCVRGEYVNDYIRVIVDRAKLKGIQSWLRHESRVHDMLRFQDVVSDAVKELNVTQITVNILNSYNSYFTEVIFMCDDSLKTLSCGLQFGMIRIYLDKSLIFNNYIDNLNDGVEIKLKQLADALKETILKIKG